MTEAPLLDRIAAHERLMDWWEDFLAKCAERQARRINLLSARALKGRETRRRKEREGVRTFTHAPTNDWDQCPACGFILVACDCDAPKFNLESKHAA